MERKDVQQRLMRKHQILKSVWYLGKDRCEEEVKKRDPQRFTKIYDKLFSVDYISDPDNKCILELPFTFYDWRRIELIEKKLDPQSLRGRKPEDTKLKWLTTNEIRSLCLNLLPCCETVIHKASANFEFARYITHKAMTRQDEDEAKFVIPFISNIDGETPLHLSIDGEHCETRVADFFLTDLLPDMPIDHHGRAIANIIHVCIDKGVPSLGNYLDSRLKTTKQLTKVGRVPDKAVRTNPHGDHENGFVTCCDLWPDERYIIDKFFEESKTESETNLLIFDIPYIHNPNMPESDLVANALVD